MTEDYKSLPLQTKVTMIAECRALFGKVAARQLCEDMGFLFVEKQKSTPDLDGESILKFIQDKGDVVTRSEALRTLRWLNASALKASIDKLVEEGRIDVESIMTSGVGRPSHRYRIKNT